ncbi:transglycosylase family protein [Streptomyces sp. NPDC058274]|uniref:transglycosylase family protein n=1 Tax=Streptomyces sp. NPDC058274 TaxID=3346416 RepID=UPI0036E98322
MLSGNGRHRRPRQAPALLVAAGVTGSAIAIPLLGATGASAADGTTWDRVAECESGGTWSADDGNGYYGGLQLTQENWEKYGGLAYAPSADQASRSQQIAVAEKVLDGEGLAVWPTCGPLSGLSKDSGSVEVDTGVAGDSSSSDGSGSTDSSGTSGSLDSSPADSSSSSPSESPSPDSSSSGASSDSAENSTKSDASSGSSGSSDEASTDAGTAKGDDSDKSGQSGDSSEATDATGTGAAGSGRHRGDSADGSDANGSSDGRDVGAAGRHASRDSGAARDAADGSYTVRPGDSLWTIADSLDLQGGWSELYADNKKSVGADPDLILPGQSLELGSD